MVEVHEPRPSQDSALLHAKSRRYNLDEFHRQAQGAFRERLQRLTLVVVAEVVVIGFGLASEAGGPSGAFGWPTIGIDKADAIALVVALTLFVTTVIIAIAAMPAPRTKRQQITAGVWQNALGSSVQLAAVAACVLSAGLCFDRSQPHRGAAAFGCSVLSVCAVLVAAAGSWQDPYRAVEEFGRFQGSTRDRAIDKVLKTDLDVGKDVGKMDIFWSELRALGVLTLIELVAFALIAGIQLPVQPRGAWGNHVTTPLLLRIAVLLAVSCLLSLYFIHLTYLLRLALKRGEISRRASGSNIGRRSPTSRLCYGELCT